jgi:hypothetical protein
MEADWERFALHAGRVREFVHRYPSGISGVLKALDMLSVQELLLPNLTHLIWDFRVDDYTFVLIRRFLGPHIKQLAVSLPDGDSFTRLSLLRTLTKRCHSLTHISLIGMSPFGTVPGFIGAISHLVCGWNQLRGLSVEALSPAALLHVATQLSLEQLELTHVTSDISLPFSRPSTIHIFPCLRELDVTCHEITFAIGLVESMSSAFLTSINIAASIVGESGFCDFINALRDHCLHSSLRSIIMVGNQEIPVTTLTFDVGPLFVFPNLTVVELYSNMPFKLDDTSLSDVARTWPRITTLILREPGHSPRITLLGLVLLAQYCTKLETLAIHLDARSVPPATPSPRVKCEALTSVDVMQSPISEPRQVASFIYDIFPRAYVHNKCLVASDEAWEFSERWALVRDLGPYDEFGNLI